MHFPSASMRMERAGEGAALFLDLFGLGCGSRAEGPWWGTCMITTDFTAEDWVERQAQALTELAAIQERYRDEFDRQHQQRIRMRSDLPGWRTFDHPSHDLRDFYWFTCAGKDRYYVGEYSSLCAVLATVRRVLAEHPAWAGLVDPFGARDKLWVQILSHGSSESLLNIISGLMARGMEVPQDGFLGRVHTSGVEIDSVHGAYPAAV